MRVDCESVSQSIEVDICCVVITTTTGPIPTAITTLSVSAIHIHHWLWRRRHTKRVGIELG